MTLDSIELDLVVQQGWMLDKGLIARGDRIRCVVERVRHCTVDEVRERCHGLNRTR